MTELLGLFLPVLFSFVFKTRAVDSERVIVFGVSDMSDEMSKLWSKLFSLIH